MQGDPKKECISAQLHYSVHIADLRSNVTDPPMTGSKYETMLATHQ